MVTSSDLVLYQYGSDTNPIPSGLTDATNPLHPAVRIPNRLSHFSEEAYDLSPESHLSKLLKVLLGDSGTGQLHKRMVLTRLQQALGGTHFLDLDAFYGGVIGINRRSYEQLSVDPFADTMSEAQWNAARTFDSSYRSRIEQFAKAINLGATPIGIEVAAEALLGVDCTVTESWMSDDTTSSTYASVQTVGTTYAVLETYSYAGVESVGGLTGTSAPIKNRHKFTVWPHRFLTPEEQYDATLVLERLRPAGSLIEVSAQPEVVYSDVSVSSIFSDSEDWTVKTRISNVVVTPTDAALYNTSTNGWIDRPFQPWGQYTGEAWSLLANNPSVLAFTMNGIPTTATRYDPAATDLPSQQGSVGSITYYYLPAHSMLQIAKVQSGRLASDGILSSNPYSGARGNDIITTTANLVADGASIDAATSLNPIKTASDQDLYWMSPPREWYASDTDAIEVRFPSTQWTNYMTLEVSHYPHILEAQAWIEADGKWVTLFTNTVTDSSPWYVAMRQKNAPEWIRISKTFTAVQTNTIRFTIRRFGTVGSASHLISLSNNADKIATGIQIGGSTTKAPFGVLVRTADKTLTGINASYATISTSKMYQLRSETNALAASICKPPRIIADSAMANADQNVEEFPAYSISLKNTDIGYRIKSLADLPISINDPNEPIASSVNAFGQSVRYLLSRWPASNAIDSTSSHWRCEPQPVPNAVVTMFMDTRDSSGNPQVIDAFEIDPLTTGPTMNIYWSNDLSDVDYASAIPSSDNQTPSILSGNLIQASNGIKFPTTDNAYLEFSNANFRWNPTATDWWIGTTLVTAATVPSSNIILFSSEDDLVQVYLSTGQLNFTYGSYIWATSASLPPNSRIKVFVKKTTSSDGLSVTLDAAFQVENVATYHQAITLAISGITTPSSTQSKFRIGQKCSGTLSTLPLASTMENFSFSYNTNVAYTDFFANPANYCRLVNSSDNFTYGGNLLSPLSGSILRFNVSMVSTKMDETGVLANKWGFVGGQPNIYDDVNWIPVARDYALRKGTIRVPTTRASLWKFEFTSLMAEPMETFLPISRLVKFFPDTQSATPGSEAAVWTDQQITAMSLASTGFYSEQLPVRDYTTNQYQDRFSPASGLVNPDPIVTAQANKQLGFGYNMMAWQPSPLSPTFPSNGQHPYVTQWIEQTNKVAFYVGLKTLKPKRSDFRIISDESAYIDGFDDTRNLSSLSMNANPGVLYTPTNATSTVMGSSQSATSNTFVSRTPVTAIQFATKQTDAFQILLDDTFQNPSLPDSTFTDTSTWHFVGDSYVYYSRPLKSVQVTRNPDVAAFTSGAAFFDPINKTPESPITSSRPLNSPTMTPGTWGGLSSGSVSTSPRGMLHAACRVTTAMTLGDPLLLQLIGSDGSTVLASTSFTPAKNIVTEQTMSYVLGTQPLLDGTVSLRIIQSGANKDSWAVTALSLFDDGCLWEFSNDSGTTWTPAYDIRNNINGILRFPNIGTGLKYRVTAYRNNFLVSYLSLRPWYYKSADARGAFPQRGPNISLYDAMLPITDDPDYTSWTEPIPQRWYAKYAKAFTLESERLYGSSTFSSFFSRTSAETIGTMTDAGTTTGYGLIRGNTEVLSITDAITTVANYTITASDAAPATDNAIVAAYSDGMTNLPIDRVP